MEGKKKMKIKTKDLLEYICWFIILIIPFNYTIINKIFLNTIFMVSSILIAVSIIFFLHFRKKITKKQIFLFFSIILIMFFELSNNYYVKQGRILNTVLFNIYLIIPFILSFYRSDEIPKIYKVLELFLVEHIVETLFVQH